MKHIYHAQIIQKYKMDTDTFKEEPLEEPKVILDKLIASFNSERVTEYIADNYLESYLLGDTWNISPVKKYRWYHRFFKKYEVAF